MRPTAGSYLVYIYVTKLVLEACLLPKLCLDSNTLHLCFKFCLPDATP